jgi:hypothetical protein
MLDTEQGQDRGGMAMKRWLTGRALGATFAAIAFTGALVGTSSGAQAIPPPGTVFQSKAFECTGGSQFFTVPAGVHHITIEAYGAQGGGDGFGAGAPAQAVGGLGGRSEVGIATNPGTTLRVDVGCKGSDASVNFSGQTGQFVGPDTGGAGGFGGGGKGGDANTHGDAGGGGGGASGVSVCFVEVCQSLGIAGGGGGGGGGANVLAKGGKGGAGGGLNGGDGVPRSDNFGAGVGHGGTQTSGGAGGAPYVFQDEGTASPGTAGASGLGGNGGSANCCTDETVAAFSGGGGGGGYFGGGGGGGGAAAPGGSGGGGSSHGSPHSNFHTFAGVRTGDGQVVISWVFPAPKQTP